MKYAGITIIIIALFGIIGFITLPKASPDPSRSQKLSEQSKPSQSPTPQPHPLGIEYMKSQEYPGSEITVEEELTPGPNYRRSVVSYRSEGLKIYAYMTVPNGEKPQSGWPVVVFNHGAIPPAQYRSTERYLAYQDAFARNGYIVFRSDYRGHGDSEGIAAGGYGRPDYTIDVLNGFTSVKRYPDSDPNRIGFWGHSMGGYITLRSMVLRKDIKAGVIWAGVVASYEDLVYNWRRPNPSSTPAPSVTPGWRQQFISQYGTPEENPSFWNSISANSYLSDISAPLQLHHATGDETVPVAFSRTLHDELKKAGNMVEYYEYVGDDHDISENFSTAIQRSVDFMDRYVKED